MRVSTEVSAGERAEFTAMFAQHVEAVWNHAYRLTGSWSKAEDLTSATFLTAWRRRADMRIVEGSPLPWLYTVVANLIILGLAPPSSRIEVVLPNGPTVPADVHGTTFAVALPEGIDIKPTDPRITFRLYDSTNKLTYSGPWSP